MKKLHVITIAAFSSIVMLSGCGSSDTAVETSELLSSVELRSALDTVYGAQNVSEGALSIESTYTRAPNEINLQIACDPVTGCTGYTLEDQDRDRLNQFNNNPLPNPYGVGRVVQMKNTYTYTQLLQACDGNRSLMNKPVFQSRVNAGAYNYGEQLQVQLDCNGSLQQLECSYHDQSQGKQHANGVQMQAGNQYQVDLSNLPVGTYYLDCNATNSAGTTVLTDAIKVTKCTQDQIALQDGSCQN